MKEKFFSIQETELIFLLSLMKGDGSLVSVYINPPFYGSLRALDRYIKRRKQISFDDFSPSRTTWSKINSSLKHEKKKKIKAVTYV